MGLSAEVLGKARQIPSMSPRMAREMLRSTPDNKFPRRLMDDEEDGFIDDPMGRESVPEMVTILCAPFSAIYVSFGTST